MAEKSFSRWDAIKSTAKNLIKYGSSAVTGEVVMVPVHGEVYSRTFNTLKGEQRIVDHTYVGWVNDMQIVDAALDATGLSLEGAPSLYMDEVGYSRFEGSPDSVA